MEPHYGPSQPTNNYDFIMNPQKPQKGFFGGVKGDPFITKILLIVGGAVVLMIVLALVVNIFFGGKTSTESIVALAQSEQEIVRLSEMGSTATGQQTKNASINTLVSVKSHQQQWVAFLADHGREIKKDELELKKDASTDSKLENAKQASAFDTTYTALMRSQLELYSAALKGAYDGSSNEQERELLSKHFNDVQLLLEQWPK